MTITINLDDELEKQLKAFCEERGEQPDEAVVDALRRRLRLYRFRCVQKQLAPYTKNAPYASEEEFLNDTRRA